MSTPGEKEKKKEADTKSHDKKRKKNDTLFNNKNAINRSRNKKTPIRIQNKRKRLITGTRK